MLRQGLGEGQEEGGQLQTMTSQTWGEEQRRRGEEERVIQYVLVVMVQQCHQWV